MRAANPEQTVWAQVSTAKRDAEGNVVIGKQWQNNDSKLGPVYAGGGYMPISSALHKGKVALKPLLDKPPDLRRRH